MKKQAAPARVAEGSTAMHGYPRKEVELARVWMLAVVALLAGSGLTRAEDTPRLPPSVWTRALPDTAPPNAPPPGPPVPAAPAPSASAAPSATPESVVPAAPAPTQESGCCDCGPAKSVWDHVPPVKPTPPLGQFYIRPTGPGY